MKSIVTGVAGFVGSTIAEALIARGESVVGVDCLTDYYDTRIKRRNLRGLVGNPAFQLVEQNLLDVEWDALLDGAGVVYHQAAQAGVRASWGGEFDRYTNWNVLATQRLLEAAKKCKDRPRIVYASSSSIYGERAKFPMHEDDLPRPVSPYGVTKLAAEHLCQLYSFNFGVPTASLRYFTVYGPRQRPDMAFHKFLRAIFRGEEIPVFGDGQQTRDFTFVTDAVAANLAAAEKAPAGAVYNIGGGSRVTLEECFAILGEVTGMPVRLKHHPRQHGDVTHTGADNSKAAAEIGWRPVVGLREGLAREAEYVRALMDEGL